MRSIAGLILAAVTASTFAADVKFNLLDNCSELSRLNSLVRTTSTPSISECRTASGPIERAIRDTAGSVGPRICFMREVPSSVLSDFHCLRYDVQGESPLTCYRPVQASIIDDYRQNYSSRYAAEVSVYLARAKQCPVSNGDTSAALFTLLPEELAVAGKHEFGFISQLGNTNPAKAAAIHGFASASPSMQRQGVEAFEYFVVYHSNASIANSARPGEHRGNWRIKTDDARDMVSQMEHAYRKGGVSLQVRIFSIDIRRDIDAAPYAIPGSLTEMLADSVAKGFEQEGFGELDQDQIESKMGIKGGDFMASIKEKMPFGRRSGLTGENESFRVFMKTSGSISCVRGERGAFGAAVIRSDGIKGVGDDFGNIGVFVFGVGACGVSHDPQRRFLDELVAGARETMMSGLDR